MKRWTLQIGIHSGTIGSRDAGSPEEYDTRADAVAAFNKAKTWYNSMGYQIWFANLRAPNGALTVLEQNPYAR